MRYYVRFARMMVASRVRMTLLSMAMPKPHKIVRFPAGGPSTSLNGPASRPVLSRRSINWPRAERCSPTPWDCSTTLRRCTSGVARLSEASSTRRSLPSCAWTDRRSRARNYGSRSTCSSEPTRSGTAASRHQLRAGRTTGGRAPQTRSGLGRGRQTAAAVS
jgi:hypothetical protein